MGGVLGGDEKSTDMALFHRNAAVIDSSGEPVLLSPPLPCQNMSQSRLVTFTKVGGQVGRRITPRRRVNLE